MTASQRVCIQCGGQLPAGWDMRKTLCSPACQRKRASAIEVIGKRRRTAEAVSGPQALAQRPCEECGTPFDRPGKRGAPWPKTCGEACRVKRTNRQNRVCKARVQLAYRSLAQRLTGEQIAAIAVTSYAPRGPATEDEVEALAARVDRELQVRGGARPTAKWIAEVVAMVGWAPK